MAGDWDTAAAGAMTSSPGYDADAEIDEVILRLDLTLVRPDDDDGAGTAGKENDHDESKNERETSSAMTADSGSSSSNPLDADRKKSKPLDFIRKLRQTGQQNENHDSAIKRKSPEPLKVSYRRTVSVFT